jgi:hypothetical protein
MLLANFCFTVAALAGLTGMGLGLYMGLSEDLTLAPAHAHLNLLGWVTMALYGLYHRGVSRERDRLAWAQVGCGAAGFPLMAGGLGAYLATGSAAFIPVVLAGSVLAIGALALFVVAVLIDATRTPARVPLGANQRALGL